MDLFYIKKATPSHFIFIFVQITHLIPTIIAND